ncbi:MAG: hypothetical protein H8E87_07100 [FCB group bacterium]|nr:hypothetical protein [FCB group bacterium]
MNLNAEETQEITGVLISLEYASSISIARFKTDEGELTLYGERRMMGLLAEYIDQPLLLSVKSDYSWSWRPTEEDRIYDESYQL